MKEGDKFKITYVDSKRSYTVDADGKIEGTTNSGGDSGGVEGQAIRYFINGPVYVFPGTTGDFEAWKREQYDDNMTEDEQKKMVYDALEYWQGVDFTNPNDEILNKFNNNGGPNNIEITIPSTVISMKDDPFLVRRTVHFWVVQN